MLAMRDVLSVGSVLIVDDSPVLRARLAELLREAGVEDVVEAGDADEALAFVYAHAPSFIVLDIHMPGRGGLSILPLLRAAPSAPLVVVLTNDPAERYRRECVARGAAFFFDKSRDFERAVAIVAEQSDRDGP